jgi:hypothetical protein
VNSENRAKRLRAEVEKRLGASAAHQGTTAKTAEEMLAKAPKRKSASEDDVLEQALLHVAHKECGWKDGVRGGLA